MSVLDNALRQIWTHGLKIVEIWKNASPTSSFGAQDIQLVLLKIKAVLTAPFRKEVLA